MANLAIKGHSSRAYEVIKILEMLGGRKAGYSGRAPQYYYYIDNFGNIIGTKELPTDIIFKVFTLEEFLEKFPYKVGDKVQHKGATSCGSVYEVEKMRWEEDTVKYTLRLFGCIYKSSTLPVEYLQPYKEEIVDTGCCSMPTKQPMYKLNIEKQKDTNKVIFDTNSQCCDISNKIIEKETMEKEISGAIVDRFICLEGYDFYDDKGNIIDTKEIIMKKKKPKYPKTYEDCCKVLLLNPEKATYSICGLEYKRHLIVKLQRLIICRDAYWKIAGDWKPDWEDGNTTKYTISCVKNKIELRKAHEYTFTLAFPTEEMRDAFYENFNELIEECKELL